MILLKILAWILFFPFMLTHWGWKRGKKLAMAVGFVLSAIFIIAGAFGTQQGYMELDALPAVVAEEATGESGTLQETVEPEGEESGFVVDFDGYMLLEVDGGDLSGDREPNVVVDIGFGDREYYAFTNEYGQLVKVVAEEIILQDDKNEPVLSTGRYFRDEAKVPGVESPVLDEGHVIADSLGGVSNAYNITPQNSTLNRHGDQAYMEDQIREAGGCSNFVAIITYSDTETQIPSHYSFTYTLKGKVIHDEFDNVNPDEVNAALAEKETEESVTDHSGEVDLDSVIHIKALDKKKEFVMIENSSSSDVDLSGWKILSVRGEQSFVFPEYVLKADSQVMVGGYDSINKVDLVWEDGNGVWSNSKSDPAELYDNVGTLKSRYDD